MIRGDLKTLRMPPAYDKHYDLDFYIYSHSFLRFIADNNIGEGYLVIWKYSLKLFDSGNIKWAIPSI